MLNAILNIYLQRLYAYNIWNIIKCNLVAHTVNTGYELTYINNTTFVRAIPYKRTIMSL